MLIKFDMIHADTFFGKLHKEDAFQVPSIRILNNNYVW